MFFIFWRWHITSKNHWIVELPNSNKIITLRDHLWIQNNYSIDSLWLLLWEYTKRFTLFFIPIIPYDSWYKLISIGWYWYWDEISYDEFVKLLPLAKLNRRLIQKEISTNEYLNDLEILKNWPNWLHIKKYSL